ncbi:MAG: YciI family protein [Lysobacterales bacterium]|nr:YciI family protein [Xanthomonadales bacterium]
MQFMLIFQEPAETFAQRHHPEHSQAYWGAWNAYIGAMSQAGIVVSGNGLQPPHTGTQVQIRDGKRIIHDGPYADTKEMLGGYFIIDVPSLDEALEWAARSPNAATGTTEVRPVLVMGPPAN